MSGGHSAVEPPVPIPNTEVKCSHVDGSATYDCVRVITAGLLISAER